MGLREVGEKLPPGFRFYPNDEELVCHYLYKKIANEETLKGTLVEIDLHICEPWQLPEVAKLNSSEWYFFSFRDRKYATGLRTNRATTSGYWKATGKDRVIHDSNTQEIVGMRKTLVFYRNRAPNGIKTGWIMHEFRLEIPHMPPKEDWVLCRVFHKGKGENNTNNQIFDNENTNNNSFSPPTTTLSNPQNTNPNCKCNHLNPSNYPSSTSLITNNTPNKEDCSSSFAFSDLINPSAKKGEDDFGFLWDDMDLEDTSNNKLGGENSHDFLSNLLNPQMTSSFGGCEI